jgi:hypothetical protein
MVFKRLIMCFLAGCFFAFLGIGCGGDKEKGANKNKERPRTADKED